MGLILPVDKIPIDYEVLGVLEQFGVDLVLAERHILANKHNHVTTTYYLLLKRQREHGTLRDTIIGSFCASQRLSLPLTSEGPSSLKAREQLNSTAPTSKPVTGSLDVSSTGGSIEKSTVKNPERRPEIDINRTKIVETSRAEQHAGLNVSYGDSFNAIKSNIKRETIERNHAN